MSAYEEAKVEAKEHYCVDYYADNCDECKRTEALIRAADKEIAKLIAIITDYEQITGTFETAEELIERMHSLDDTKDAELARLREAYIDVCEKVLEEYGGCEECGDEALQVAIHMLKNIDGL